MLISLERHGEMRDRQRQKRRLRRPMRSADDVRRTYSPHRTSMNQRNGRRISGMEKIPLAFWCAVAICYQTRFEVHTANAFSVFRPESITSASTYSSSSFTPRRSPTSLFLFSLRNDNNGDGDSGKNDDIPKEDGSTTTIQRSGGWNAGEESEDFSAWMEGLRMGTPLGKMASSAATPEENDLAEPPDSIPINPPPTKAVNSVNLRKSKSKKDSSSAALKINPLSNLIQFEAMLELAKIAGNKDADEKEVNGIETTDSSSASDVFAVVDRLVKTFQIEEEGLQQKERNELLQLAQLEETIAKENDEAKTTSENISAATTVKDLMELDRNIGGIPFLKLSNIWDSFSSKAEPADIDKDTNKDDVEDKDKKSMSASSSPLFRGNEDGDALTVSGSNNLAQAAESILKDTTNKMEYLVAEASSSILDPLDDGSSSSSSTSALQDLVGRASSVFNGTSASTSLSAATTGTIVESISNDIVAAAQKIAKESGVDFNVQFAADRAREATEYAVGVTTTANTILDAGYAYGSRSGAAGMSTRDDNFNYLAASAATQTAGSVLSAPADGSVAERQAQVHQPPLFGDFASAQRIEPHEYDNVVFQGAVMGGLAGAIYEDRVEQSHKFGHSLVANGTTANVAWMVTDFVMDREHCTAAFSHHDDAIVRDRDDSKESPSGPILVRTITIRGFDASDESVDREALLNDICFATSEPLDDATADKVVFHKGLLDIARQIYADTKKYIDWASPNHKIVLNGHSVGGSLSILMLLLITSECGADYVRDRILRTYSHGSPPVATLASGAIARSLPNERFGGTQRCPILEAFDLPPSMVYGYIQPYDPVVRLFSDHDVLYPLVDDLGKDGITLYSSGPVRSLRPMVRAIFQAWDGWPQFRDNWKGTCDMEYQSVGIQHILLPEPLRYLNDRFISVNVGVPPVDAIVRISPEDLLPALDLTFPLDTFQVSLIPQAVRSFLHHFFPAYDSSIGDYATKIRQKAKMDEAKKKASSRSSQAKKA